MNRYLFHTCDTTKEMIAWLNEKSELGWRPMEQPKWVPDPLEPQEGTWDVWIVRDPMDY